MILNDVEYKKVLLYCQQLHQNMTVAKAGDCFRLGITVDTAVCIHQQLYARRVKKLSPVIENDIAAIAQV